ncbi:MAG: hypothetical protein HQL70_11055 [Magnetococcales bacterium]|nr:hypothetical protein [Magnetococcales bacterium]
MIQAELQTAQVVSHMDSIPEQYILPPKEVSEPEEYLEHEPEVAAYMVGDMVHEQQLADYEQDTPADPPLIKPLRRVGVAVVKATQPRTIGSLLASAELNIKRDQLSVPAANNALKNLRAVLAMDPENAQAKDGLKRVAERYVELAEEALAMEDWKTVDNFLSKAETIHPQLDSLRRVRAALKEAMVE